MGILRFGRQLRVLAGVAVVALLLAACGGGGGGGTAAGGAEQPVKGGTLVIGAEQEPDCLDVYGSCSGASWGYWVGLSLTVPRPLDVDAQGKFVASPLLDGEPTLSPGPPQKVTYKIKSNAVWSDGQPITSTDFKWTWNDIVNGKDIYSKTGYDKIASIDDSNPKVAVVTFKQDWAPWRNLFGGGDFYGVLPSHLLKGKDRDKELKDGFKWSGGPYMIQSWNKGQDLTMIPNPKYWGPQSNVDKIVFKFITDSSAELQAYKTGQVQMIYPQPQIALVQQLKSLPDTKYTIDLGTTEEGLWFNARKKPLDSMAVRQAIGYAVDREAIVNQLIRPMKADAPVLNSFNVPNFPQYTSQAYAKYNHDLNKVQQLMTGDGWTKGADGIWAKGGQKASFTISTTAGNKGRELVEQLLQSQFKEAGFVLKINNTKAGTLFGEWLPQGVHQVAMYAQVGSPDPDWCPVFCADQIPGPANNNSGQNFQYYGSATLDKPWKAQQAELDDTKRAVLVKQGEDQLATEIPAIPLYQKLLTLVWSTKIGGPVRDAYVQGPFYNANLWWLKQ